MAALEPSGDSELLAALRAQSSMDAAEEEAAPAAVAAGDLVTPKSPAVVEESLTPKSVSPIPSVDCDYESRVAPVAADEATPASPRDGELAVQRELRAGGLDRLLEKYPLKARRHADYPELVCLKYNANTFSSAVMRECRGIIVNAEQNWDVAAMPFRKFMNHGERGADYIDWSRARVYEKLDGSLSTVYFHKDKWHVASTSLPDASGNCSKYGTFASIFWDIWKNSGYKMPADPNMTYYFEMLTHRNPILCAVPRERIVLLGARRVSDLSEEAPEPHAERHGWECARSFPLSTLEEVSRAARELNAGATSVPDDEGFVVCDMGNFNRVKVKSPKYVMLGHLRGRVEQQLSDKQLLPVVLSDEVSEVSAHFQHLAPRLRQLECALEKLAAHLAAGKPTEATQAICLRYAERVPAQKRGSTMEAILWLRTPAAVDPAKLLKVLAGFDEGRPACQESGSASPASSGGSRRRRGRRSR